MNFRRSSAPSVIGKNRELIKLVEENPLCALQTFPVGNFRRDTSRTLHKLSDTTLAGIFQREE
jgi:hypothetical protein